MGKVCAAYGCNNKDGCKNKGISLHMFPKEPTLREQWAFAMKRKGFKPTKYSSVCSLHFRPQDYEPADKRPRGRPYKHHNHLKKDVVPSIFSFSDVTTLMHALEEQGGDSIEKKLA